MSAPMAKEMEFTEHHLGGGEEVSGEIGGEIYIPVESSGTNAEDSGTLDEPVTTTLKRDLKAILKKCLHVLMPIRANKSLLHDWDLWGPLILCVVLSLSFFQSVCTLGYCLLPLTLSLILSRVFLTVLSSLPKLLLVLRLVIICVAMLWSTRASLGFLSDYLPQDRKILAVYPIALFYISLAFLILAQNRPFI